MSNPWLWTPCLIAPAPGPVRGDVVTYSGTVFPEWISPSKNCDRERSINSDLALGWIVPG